MMLRRRYLGLKEADKDKQLADMRKQIEELKRKTELTSQQAQGEVQEIELELYLERVLKRKVDLVDKEGLRPELRDDILIDVSFFTE